MQSIISEISQIELHNDLFNCTWLHQDYQYVTAHSYITCSSILLSIATSRVAVCNLRAVWHLNDIALSGRSRSLCFISIICIGNFCSEMLIVYLFQCRFKNIREKFFACPNGSCNPFHLLISCISTFSRLPLVSEWYDTLYWITISTVCRGIGNCYSRVTNSGRKDTGHGAGLY